MTPNYLSVHHFLELRSRPHRKLVEVVAGRARQLDDLIRVVLLAMLIWLNLVGVIVVEIYKFKVLGLIRLDHSLTREQVRIPTDFLAHDLNQPLVFSLIVSRCLLVE